MDVVKTFNTELSALYESKPPVSRAKMAQLTKSAIKAIKFYKHVVQSVEKFIMKCRPEYKVPGLYVIDSIVRQSHRQFSMEKDVFAPRFTKNITTTFQHLYKCPAEDKSKIVRVLNLWQKNGVFPSEVIQPLMDLAPDPSNPDALARAQTAVAAAVSAREAAKQVNQQLKEEEALPDNAGNPTTPQNDVLRTVTQLLQQSQEIQSLGDQNQQLQQLQLLQQQLVLQTQLLQQPDQEEAPVIDSNLLTQIQQLTAQLLNKSDDDDDKPAFNKNLLDFDYGESDEEENKAGMDDSRAENMLVDPGMMPNMQPMPGMPPGQEHFMPGHATNIDMRMQLDQNQTAQMQHFQQSPDGTVNQVEEGEIPDSQENEFEEHNRDRRHRRRSRSRSRSRSRWNDSHSRDRRRRSRSRERDRHRRSRDRDRDREKQRERERERRKMGLPPVKEGHLSVCSKTLWIGHLNKQTTENDLLEEFDKYAKVVNIALVPPRGCAYVTLTKRKDAARALDRLKGAKLLGNTLKAAWAMGTGIRESSYKNSWDMDLGVTYIPWSGLGDVQLEKIEEGAVLDEDSLPENLKQERERQASQAETSQQEILDNIPDDLIQPTGAAVSAVVPQIIPAQPTQGMVPVLPLGSIPPVISMPPLGVPPPAVRALMPGQPVPGVIPRATPPAMAPRPGAPAFHIAAPNAIISSGGELPTQADAMLSKVGIPPAGSLGLSLQQAIQNIVNNSTSITAVAQSSLGPSNMPPQLTQAVRPVTSPSLRTPHPLQASPSPVNAPGVFGIRMVSQEQPTVPESIHSGPPIIHLDPNRPPLKTVTRLGIPAGGPPSLLRQEFPRGPNPRFGGDAPFRPPSGSVGGPGMPFNQRPGGPLLNSDLDMDLDGDIDGPPPDHRFPGPMGPRGPMRGPHPNFRMRSPGMHPRNRRPQFGPDHMDFSPFNPGGPRHRKDFRGRGRGFRGRGGGDHRQRMSLDGTNKDSDSILDDDKD